MKEQDLLDATSPRFTNFDESKHNVLCSELKQLYVAITRTRQRLWICENKEELSKPMFDYWKKLCLVQVRQLDDSLAQAMQVASSPEEWKSRGIKLLQEHNYVMATMCFERAGDTYWENLSNAAGLKAAADHMHGMNPKKARKDRRQAAEIFESIGKADSAAECFFALEEYERAGRLYLEKCGESKLAMAGECFSLAERYDLAAEVYAKGNFFSECLSVCARGKLFDMGLQYIKYWKRHATTDSGMVERSTEIDRIEQGFLESCALHYHELEDNRAMMKFVEAFHSMDTIRTFLKNLGCLKELQLLEEESGNYLEAANIAKLRGDLLREAELLGKAGHYKEASEYILWYVFANSLWFPGSKGWPLKQFTQKEELLTKAKAFAKNVSELFYETVCTEADILSNKPSSLFEMRQFLSASQRHKSLRGEILSARTILDAHLDSNTSKYEWEDDLVGDLTKHSEDRISQNRVSLETLVYFWNFWKDKILNIFECLGRLETQDVKEYRSYGNFCLNYFGVWRQYNNLNTIFILLNSDASWAREVNGSFQRRNGELILIDIRKFVSVARSYWYSELLSVGMKVLENLEALFKFSTKNYVALFCQSMPLIHIFDVAMFLLESESLDHHFSNNRTVQKFLEFSTDHFFGYVFPLDWRKSLTENMICLRGTELSQNLLKRMVFETVNSKNNLTYGQIGRVVMMILGSGKPSLELYEKIAKRFDGNQPWKTFVENLCGNIGSASQVPSPSNSSADPGEGPLVYKFLVALEDTFNGNWRKEDYISPSCFLYLVERLLIWVFYYWGYFFTTKSSFVEWLFYQDCDTNTSSKLTGDMQSILRGICSRVAVIVEQLLYNSKDTIEWVKISNVNLKDYYPMLVLRLVVILCLLCVNSEKYDLLFSLLGRSDITSQLPREFSGALRRIGRHKHSSFNLTIIAEALKKIENPLVMASRGNLHSIPSCSDFIFVDLKVKQCREDILRELFPKKAQASQGHDGAVELATANQLLLPSSTVASIAEQDSNTLIETEGNLQMSYEHFWDIFNALKSAKNDKDVNPRSIIPNVPMIKVELEKYIPLISAAVTQSSQKNFCDGEDANLLGEATSMLDELRQLSEALDVSGQEVEKNLSKIEELIKRLQLRKPRLEPFLNLLSKTSIALGSQSSKEDSNIKAEEKSHSDMGKMKASEASVANNPDTGSNRGMGNSKNKKGRKAKGRKK